MNQAKRRLLTTIPLNSPPPAPPNGPERADTLPTPNSEKPNRTGMPIRLLALFTAITVVMSWPYPLQIQTSLYNWSDALLNSWTLAWGSRILLTDPFNLFNANIFYPYPNTLAYSESLVPQTALAMPIILLTGLPSLAHNLLALSSFVLAAFGAYLLVYDLTRSRGASLVAGVIYTFTSYKMMHFAHLQLLSSQWLPFALLYARRMFNLPGTRARVVVGRVGDHFRSHGKLCFLHRPQHVLSSAAQRMIWSATQPEPRETLRPQRTDDGLGAAGRDVEAVGGAEINSQVAGKRVE